MAQCDCSRPSIIDDTTTVTYPFTADKIVFQIGSDRDLEAARSCLEGINCPVTIEIHERDCGEVLSG